MSKIEMLKTLNEYLYDNEVKRADMIYLRQAKDGQWHEMTWKEVMTQARKVCAFLKGIGLKKGDKVSILSKNCAEWFITDFAIAMGGFISVPFYGTQSKETISFILDHAEVKAIFVGKLDNWPAQEGGIPEHVIRISFPYDNPMPAKYRWKDILTGYDADLTRYVPDMHDLYSIVYTSGTTGNPKGVMLPFEAHARFMDAVGSSPLFFGMDHVHMISYMPLGHAFERLIVEATSVRLKMTVSFPESLATFAKNLQDVSPTFFIAAPRIWTQFQKAVFAKIPQERLELLLKIPVVGAIIKKKIRKSLGLDRSRVCGSGSAPISTSLLAWYEKIGIHIIEGYGRTEDLAYVSMADPASHIPGTVGKAHPNVEVKIGEDGEILTRSKIQMAGYYKSPEATKAAFTEDGFLRTGDQGTIDSEGYLRILGRMADPFKTDKGEFVNPVNIEGKFATNPDIEQLCLIGLTLPQPVLLVTLSLAAWSLPKERVTEDLMATLHLINPDLTNYEKVSHIIVVKESWSPENGLLTPTLKIKRSAIHAKYIDLAHKVLENSDPIFWE